MLSYNLKKQKERNVRTPWNQNISVTLMYTSKTDGLDFPIKVVKQNDTQMDLLQKEMHALWLAFLFMRFAALPRRDTNRNCLSHFREKAKKKKVYLHFLDMQ